MKPLSELLASRALRIALTALLLLAGAALHPAAPALAQGTALDAPKPRASSDDGFLPVDEAFKLGSLPATAPDQVRLVWQIADGYYLYHQRIKIKTSDPAVHIGAIDMPPGIIKNDEFFGKQEIYHHELTATVNLSRAGGAPTNLPLQVTYQGCAEKGLCFPPVTKTLNISLPGGTAGAGTTAAAKTATGAGGYVSEQDRYMRIAASGNIFLLLGAFFAGGLLVACTPCVLPMVAILFAIIGGQKQLSAGRAFGLSLTYVLGMAFTYSLAGAITALAGSQVQALFQQPWVLVLFSVLLAAMAMAMFGLFTVQMPSAIQTRVAAISNRQSGGTFGGVAAMGALSALIVTTCVAPVLVGALALISQTGDVVRGATALFAMSMGMGAPLLVLGASQGKLMPRLGPWMETIKHLCGALLLAVAVWLLDRVLPDRVGLALWALPAGAAAWVLIKGLQGRSVGAWTGRLAGSAAGLYAVVVLAGAGLGGTDPLAPLPMLAAHADELPFQTIKSVADLDRQVALAHSRGKSVMLDFYADWCASCKEMQKYTFTDAGVRAALTGTVLLRANVTDNDADDQALMKRFNIPGPPTIAFYDKDGQERTSFRVVGYMKAADFAPLVRQALRLQAAGAPKPAASPAS